MKLRLHIDCDGLSRLGNVKVGAFDLSEKNGSLYLGE